MGIVIFIKIFLKINEYICSRRKMLLGKYIGNTIFLTHLLTKRDWYTAPEPIQCGSMALQGLFFDSRNTSLLEKSLLLGQSFLTWLYWQWVGWVFAGQCLCAVGCSAASLVSTHAQAFCNNKKNVFGQCQMSHEGQNPNFGETLGSETGFCTGK